MQIARLYAILYVALIVVIYIITHMTTILKPNQTTELLVSSILFMFFMGILRTKLTGIDTSTTIAVYGFYYTLWFFTTKAVVNALLKNDDGLIVTT